MAHHLTIAPLDQTIEVADGQTILEACLGNGIWIPYACGHGRCSTCKVEVTEGEIDHGPASPFALMDFERQDRKALACCATLKSDVTIEAEIDEDEDAHNHPIRQLIGRVVDITALTPTVRRIRLAIPAAAAFAFQAGQYVNVEVPGVTGARAFSIANAPSADSIIELHVRRVDGGAATTHLHDRLELGHELRLAGPFGRFFVRARKQTPRIYVAGGSGLSSIYAMVHERIAAGCTVPTTIVHGARSVDELYARDELAALAAAHAHVRYVPAISDGGSSDIDGIARGYAHEVLARLYDGRFAGNTAYLCGPPPMVEACIRVLMKGRLFEKDIFTERFITQADGESALARSPIFKRI